MRKSLYFTWGSRPKPEDEHGQQKHAIQHNVQGLYEVGHDKACALLRIIHIMLNGTYFALAVTSSELPSS
jgi:hypothetical protein